MKTLSSKELLAALQQAAGYEKRRDAEIRQAMKVVEVQMRQQMGEEKEKLEEYLLQIKELEKNLPTEYQETWTYSILLGIFKEMESVLEEVENSGGGTGELPAVPTFGTVRMGDFSAQIACSDREDYLIVFSEGLFGFANLFSKVLGDCFEVTKEKKGYTYSTDFESVKKRMEKKGEIQKHFDDLILAYMAAGNPHAARQYFPTKELGAIASIIRDGIEIFVAAHEYSHLVLGHLACENKKFMVMKINGGQEENGKEENEKIREYMYQWKDEVEADTLAMQITMAVMYKRGYDRALSFIGVYCAMLALDLAEKMENLKAGKNADSVRISATHPPAKLRKQVLYEMVSREDKNVVGLMETIENIVETLWKNFMGFYRSLDSAKKVSSVLEIPYPVIQTIIYRRK